MIELNRGGALKRRVGAFPRPSPPVSQDLSDDIYA
jgi:hypothetical protein